MPKIVDHDQYRKELLAKCFDLFAQTGYGSITMRQIAQGLNVSTGTLYHYFPSKQALFEQLVEEINQQEILTAMAELGGRQTLQETMDALGKYLSKHEDYYIKLHYILVDFCQHQDSKQMWGSGIFQRVDERCQQAVRDVLGIEDSTLISFVLLLIDGLILERLLGNEKISFTAQCNLLGKMLTAYLQQYPSNQRSKSESYSANYS
ncbi:TetR/AcrR family transcriptional regulator [Dendronalium sp. ChiSLP03b]|uniref:TetR/AcrR family transcriptional regulator n=1 Tax=Dendronalium sp. ChiSLP03b TaxID=3075381 RepID=UPI002AD3E4F8|nr:TetR/AcrR family transcriptional regulator [Dendronalium sp. ChiSLP03b]MDZ8205153.1 TetR/AcrR family transcriptional regulator [Dendronalium sp. ChiSLP03b]